MDILYLLIPIAVFLVILAIGAFFWAVKNDQFEDLEGPAHRILYDEPETSPDVKELQKPGE
jgi:cbb3-type cytochrome oxidase maturation protein